uniref:Lipid-A-disaccharide synthase n=1 Tax=Candidatus Kentrum sp. TUN TaxID=2126343 RepID=A0A450ZL57_9GAMM|nr:MAG: lipid-A-disaccharide synthase [Candidatus Kentron sp. TUN]VFK57117.1 MAG: lipid-A-disaccharide synthase [Candidatus Kentron sp. TUN]VFK57901.1 MAG: lipid-A-disaccharide synthase [Candidatus Kentron sp. TUN]
MVMTKPFRIAIVAGEPSGDLLGAGLLRALTQQRPHIQIEGIGGPQMIAAGCHSLYPMERLSVAGLSEAVTRLPELLSIRARLGRHFCRNLPDIFIGIDAPDFNLSLERRLRQSNIPVVHYVSPTVWAWRGYRIKKIAQSVDLMLTLFPFEMEIYAANGIPVRFVGHPLADAIPKKPDREQARREISLPRVGKIIALLPGSRLNEVQSMAIPMIRTARWLSERRRDVHFVVPLINAVTREHFHKVSMQEGKDIPITIVEERSRAAMAAADAVLVAAGTATLEALLLQRPMVIALRVSTLTYHIGKLLATVGWVGLPNLLAKRSLVPEFLQKDVTPEKLGEALLEILENPQPWITIQEEFRKIGATLRQGADQSAANAVLELLESNTKNVEVGVQD